MREAIAAANRVVVKVGSSSLPAAGASTSIEFVRWSTSSPARAWRAESWSSCPPGDRGRSAPALRARPQDLATQQAAASVGQGLLMGHYTRLFGHHGLGVGQVLLTVDDVTRRSLPQRVPDVRQIAGARGCACRQRERHRGDTRDPVRRQ